jgi:hypothetical protein
MHHRGEAVRRRSRHISSVGPADAQHGSAATHRKRGGWTSPVDVKLLEWLSRDVPITTEELTRAYNREAARPRRVYRSSVLRTLHRADFCVQNKHRDRRNRIVRMSKPSGGSDDGPSGWIPIA